MYYLLRYLCTYITCMYFEYQFIAQETYQYLYKIMRYKIKLCLKYVFRQKSWYYQSPDYEIQFCAPQHKNWPPSPQSQNQMILISSCKPFFTLAIMVFKSSTCYQLSIFNTARSPDGAVATPRKGTPLPLCSERVPSLNWINIYLKVMFLQRFICSAKFNLWTAKITF